MIKGKLGFDMDGIIQSLDNYDITEDEMNDMKEKMKLMDDKLREKNKPKTITISGYSHSIIKKYCTSMNLNIGDWVTKILLKEIESNKCTIDIDDKEEYRKVETEEILKRYEESIKDKSLYKTNKLIFNKQFAFKGYSLLDGYPLYECDFRNVSTLLDEFGVDCKLVKSKEIGKGIHHNMDLEVELLIPEKIIPTNDDNVNTLYSK